MEEERFDDTPKPDIPYIVHESEIARLERINKRFWILILTLVILLVGTNCVWIWYESQFQDDVVTVEAQTDSGGPAIANASGEVTFNGESESNGQAQNP